ncbi:2TM domain-containing protein [Chitinimonas arctica]|uniref:2TM domain-containing protein n=1 Tax=Chitinimonas arctica TaxID=2594795 RepID=A0A516SCE8_9NEIS|nr:2TM domain-containing protein [Chitinimonas arctica]QDQ25821.1 2TM domain-containing protein [Chitinimonas arctica]
MMSDFSTSQPLSESRNTLDLGKRIKLIDEAALRRGAEQVVGDRLDLHLRAIGFLATSALLCAINWKTQGRISWAAWPMLGMGFVLTMQTARFYLSGDAQFEKRVAQEMAAVRHGKDGK